jgi:hypothetical protein
MDKIKTQFKDIYKKHNIENIFNIPLKEKYTNVEILKYIKQIQEQESTNDEFKEIDKINHKLFLGDKKKLQSNISLINDILKHHDKTDITKYQTMNKNELKMEIEKFINLCKKPENKNLLKDALKILTNVNSVINTNVLNNDIELLNNNVKQIKDYMCDVKTTLDKAVHGHDKAKTQIERIIGQWINGEQDGYCFGFEGPPGVGKCFAKNTPIMLFNGDIKMVQDITIDDKLMGDDSSQRNILALGNSREKMYRIEQQNGDDYIVNESHILSLKLTTNRIGKKSCEYETILEKRYLKGDTLDICIRDYLGLPKYIKECLKGYKVGVDFCEKTVYIDSYALGYWLGNESAQIISINDILTNKLKEYNLIDNKHIPMQYKCNSRGIRLKLLAGLIDSIGHYNKNNNKNSIEIIQKNQKLAEDIIWLVRSLGFKGSIYKKYEKYEY